MSQSVYIRTAEPLQFVLRHLLRVADNAAFAAAKRNVDHGTFPGHPCCQRADSVNRLLGVKSDASLVRPSRVVILHAERLEYSDAAVVHLDRQADVHLSHRLPKHGVYSRIQIQLTCRAVKLSLCYLKRVLTQ